MYYICSENKGADQLRGYREADLRLCFRICKKTVFSRSGSYASLGICQMSHKQVCAAIQASLKIENLEIQTLEIILSGQREKKDAEQSTESPADQSHYCSHVHKAASQGCSFISKVSYSIPF